MAANFIIVEDDSLEKAIQKACRNLKVTSDDIEVEVLKPGRRGLIFSTPFRIKASIKKDSIIDERFKNQELQIMMDLEDAESMLGHRDGSISFEKDSSGVYIIVQPPSGEGRSVSAEEVYTVINDDAGIINVDSVAINRSFMPMNYGQRIRIADFSEDLSNDKDSEIFISISSDSMFATLKFTPPKGEGLPPTYEQVLISLQKAGVTITPDEEEIRKTINAKRYNEELVIVKGKAAENGLDSCIKWKVGDFDKQATQVMRSDGSVDFKKVFELNNVKANSLLGVIQPPTPGVDGTTVTGKILPATPGIERPIRVGKNVTPSQEGDKFYATMDGQFSKEHGLGNVLPVHEVEGDVDYSCGDIDFFGTVMIHGSVMDGFTVKAGGNICVSGTVNEATLEAGGQVTVSGGFLGKSKGIIRSGSDVALKFAEGGTIEAGENVLVDNAILHCEVLSGGKVEVKGRKGKIVGGNILARDEIYAIDIGTMAGTKTYLTVGVDKMTRDKMEHVYSLLKETEDKMDKLEKSLNHLRVLEQSGAPLTENQKELAGKIEIAVESLEERVGELEYEYETLQANVSRKKRGVVRAYSYIYGGVHITIRGVNYHVKTDIQASTLTLDGDDVRITPL